MATDATGTPTPLGIPKFDTSVDAPSGLGTNAMMDAIDSLISSALKTVFRKAGTLIGTRGGLNLIEGSNVTITMIDDGPDDRVNVTIAAAAPAGVPTGTLVPFAGSVAPSGWALADGSAVARSGGTYDALFSVISTSYGAGDGSTTFNLPDMRGRMAVGQGTHTDVATLGLNEGVSVGARRPAHKHSVGDPGHTHTTNGPWQVSGSANSGSVGGGSSNGANAVINSATTGITVGPQTGSEPNNSSAYLVVNHIIKL